jgi:hypothetical protein
VGRFGLALEICVNAADLEKRFLLETLSSEEWLLFEFKHNLRMFVKLSAWV